MKTILGKKASFARLFTGSRCTWYIPAILILLTHLLIMPLLGGTTGKLAGIVTDKSSGEPMAGVNVFLKNTTFGASTDLDGYFVMLNIPPGRYELATQMVGYKEVTVTGIKVTVDLTTQVNVKLSTENIEGEEIVVIADRPLIQKDLTSSSVTLDSEEIEALPVDNFNEVVNLQAGVVAGHFRGGRDGEVAYMLDGIPINDPFNNGIGVEVENSSIQQLEVISGTFNAEYGQAMSGIVNIITREGSHKYEGSANTYASNYFSNKSVFTNIDQLDNIGSRSFQGSFGGPLPFFKNIRFFATGRHVENDGYLFGRRVYNVSDSDPFLPTGDSAFVPMNNWKESTFNGKLTYYLLPSVKLNYGIFWGDVEGPGYDHGYQLTPDGILTHFRNNLNHNVSLTHTLSNSTFYSLRFSHNVSDYTGYLYEDPNDPRYVIPEQGLPLSGYTFRSGGNQNWRYNRTTTTNFGKFELTSQVNRIHKIGLGATFTRHDVDNFGTAFRSELVGIDTTNFTELYGIAYPDPGTPGFESYQRQPLEFSAYIQDKIEYEDFIINVGLRYDYFDPKTQMLSDNRNPEFNPLFPAGNTKAPTKSQLSPRLGIAFPISTQGVIHVSYGHFFQTPVLSNIYQGIYDWADGTSRYAIEKGSLSTIIGNPDLDAQRTITYEMGIKQALAEHIGVEFTAYYRDIRNLVGTQIIETYDQNQYGRYINLDYGNVRGIILAFEKRFFNHWGGRLDYTYQIAEGNASDPRSAFFNNQSSPPQEPEKQFIALDWDQRSTLNFSLSTGTPGNWNVTFVGKYGSGTPYTADIRFTGVNVNFRNNRIKPVSLIFDLRADKTITIAGTKIQGFLWVQNIFDRLNEWSVYGSSGRANLDLNTQFAGDIIGLNTLDDFVNNPTFYSPPRQIRLGFSVGL